MKDKKLQFVFNSLLVFVFCRFAIFTVFYVVKFPITFSVMLVSANFTLHSSSF